MATSEQQTQQAETLTIPSDLSPADADAVKSQAISAVEGAKESGCSLTIAFESERAAPCAAQILVATRRSADAAGVVVEMSEETIQVVSSLGLKI